MQWDAFISHASEDKEAAARPLAQALTVRGLKVWFDEFTLRVGDSLRTSVDEGLASSRSGIVILSPAFFAKRWPQWELDGLFAREVQSRHVILPVWFNVGHQEVAAYSPMLAGRLAASFSAGLDGVVARLLDVLLPEVFVESPCIKYLTDRCGFEITVVRESILDSSSWEELVRMLIMKSGRLEMWVSMVSTFELPQARVELNDARQLLGLERLPHEYF